MKNRNNKVIFVFLLTLLYSVSAWSQTLQLSGLKVYTKPASDKQKSIIVVEVTSTSWPEKAELNIRMGTAENSGNVFSERAIINKEDELLSVLLFNKKYQVQNGKLVLEIELKEDQKKLARFVELQLKTNTGQWSNVVKTTVK